MSKTGQSRTRALKPEDLDAVIEIDRRITGRARRGFFEKRLKAAQSGTDTFIAMATEDEDGGALTGYAIARVQAGEFGDDRLMAILDIIGVDPACQHSGLGTQLIDGVAKTMQKLGIKELRTQAPWTDYAVIPFFAANGFTLTSRIVLERPATQLVEPLEET